MKRHTNRRRNKREGRARRSKSRSGSPRLNLRLSVPVTWENVTEGATGSAREKRSPSHAVSWRTGLKSIFASLLVSPRWASLLLLVMVGLALYTVGADKRYYVSEAAVVGAVTLSQDTVVETSGVDGMHIFWLDPAETAKRLIGMPNVLTATVKVGLPRQVDITLVERAPVMVWDQRGDRFWVDGDGRLMQARQEMPNLLMILSQDPESLDTGDSIPVEVLEGALQLRQERPNITSLFYERENGLSYQDGRNWRAYFGVGNDMNQKLVVYETMVEDLMARDLQLEYISVINKEKPYYRLRESSE